MMVSTFGEHELPEYHERLLETSEIRVRLLVSAILQHHFDTTSTLVQHFYSVEIVLK